MCSVVLGRWAELPHSRVALHGLRLGTSPKAEVESFIRSSLPIRLCQIRSWSFRLACSIHCMYRGLAANSRAVKISCMIARTAGNVSLGPRGGVSARAGHTHGRRRSGRHDGTSRMTASFEVIEAQFALEFLLLLLDRPPLMGQGDQGAQRCGRGQVDEVVLASRGRAGPPLRSATSSRRESSTSRVVRGGDTDGGDAGRASRPRLVPPRHAPPRRRSIPRIWRFVAIGI